MKKQSRKPAGKVKDLEPKADPKAGFDAAFTGGVRVAVGDVNGVRATESLSINFKKL